MSEFPLIQYMYNLWLYTLFQIYFHLFQVSSLAVKEDMTAIQLKSCLGLKSLIDFSLLFHLSDSFISSTLHLKPGNNIAAVISIVAACCCKGRFTQKRVHLTWTIWLSTSPFEERRGQNNCSLFGTFFDCNLRSATQVEWMWSGVCALHRLNYTITFHLPSDDFFFFLYMWQHSQLWQARAKYWSHKCTSSNSLQFVGLRWTLQINWNEIMKRKMKV